MAVEREETRVKGNSEQKGAFTNSLSLPSLFWPAGDGANASERKQTWTIYHFMKTQWA